MDKDHEKLREHIDDKVEQIRGDLSGLREDLHDYAKRQVKLETEQGWIKRGLFGVFSAIGTAIITILVKWPDLFK